MRQQENIKETAKLMEKIRVSDLTPFQKQAEYKRVQSQINKPKKKKRRR